ncbi:MAG: glycosyltransferase family 9 protein [Planctomycetota bacterium]|jgi:lipopolysaccharide heptosyltransferase I
MSKCFNNILIVKPSSFGDIVLALPALGALRKSFPRATLSWLIRPEYAPLLKDHPYLDNIILFDRRFLGKAWYHPGAMARLFSLIRLLHHRKFDAVIDLQGLLRTASLAWLSGCKKRFGIKNAREFAHVFYSHKVPQDIACTHVVDYYLKIVKTAGAHECGVEFLLPVDPAAADSVGSRLESDGIDVTNYAVLVPGSAHADKCWPVERFALLADKIHSEFGLSITAVGTAPEKSITARLSSLANSPVANLAGLTNVTELVALLKSARLVVSNDTGPGHVAAALGTPLVMIFGRSNPARVAPYQRPNTIVAVEPDKRFVRKCVSSSAHRGPAAVQQSAQKIDAKSKNSLDLWPGE